MRRHTADMRQPAFPRCKALCVKFEQALRNGPSTRRAIFQKAAWKAEGKLAR